MLRRGRSSQGSRGSVLLLVPAAVLVVLVLASIAVDFTVAFLGERSLADLSASAANDAATAAVDVEHLRATGEFRLDQARAEQVVAATLAASSTPVDIESVLVTVTSVDGEPAVSVRLRGTVGYLFAKALPGAPDTATVEAAAVAVAVASAG